MRSIPFLMGFAACVGVGGPTTDDSGAAVDDWQPVSYVDEGELCFENQGVDVVVQVTAPDCLSSSCSRNLAGTCEGTLSGDTITLTSDIHWEDNVGEGVACTDDCGAPTVSCTLPALADGTYVVVLGGVETELVVPVVGSCGDR